MEKEPAHKMQHTVFVISTGMVLLASLQEWYNMLCSDLGMGLKEKGFRRE